MDHKADALASADGDGDRPLVVDEKGRVLRGDVLGILVADLLEADSVSVPVSCNTALEESGRFRNVDRTRIGSPYVIASMLQAVERGYRRVVGYEANGGFLTMTPFELDGRRLCALPTRDAVVVALAVLLLAQRHGLPVSQLASLLPARFTDSDRLQDFATAVSARHIAALAADPQAIEQQFPWLGEVSRIDQTDGLRITFANEEIVHLRPSGNAPELRCYTEADSAQRARELNTECMRVLQAWRE